MLSIGLLRGGQDIGGYYAADDYYSADASTIEREGQEPAREASPVGGEAAGEATPEGGSGGRRRNGNSAPGAGGSEASGNSTRDRGDGDERPTAPALAEGGGGEGRDVPAPERGKGQWFGRGAEALELRGAVDPKVLNAIIGGELPNGVTLGTRPDKGSGAREHTGGWDLTFSAPKSVSVLAEITGSRELFKAHNDAVKEAVTWLEDEAATIRRSGILGRKTEQTGNLVVALFQHDTSREQDPQLHTHALVMNATQREDGKWRSLHSRPLFEHKMAAGNVYRAALALALQKAGFEIERTHSDGRFEITSVPREVAEHFSKRRVAIDQKLEAWGQDGAEMSAKAAIMTRAHKRRADLPTLRGEWTAAAQALGFDAEQTLREGLADAREVRPVSPKEGLVFLREAIDRLSEREAAFTHADLVGATLAAGMGRLDVAAAQAIAREATRTQGLDLYQARIGERRAWTTPKAAEQERRIEQQVQNGKGAVDAIASARSVTRELADSELNQGQRDAVKLLVSSSDQFVAVVGRPGTGKTTMVRTVKALLDREGYRAVGMAPNGAAAKELEAGGGLIGARTVASQIARIGRTVSGLRHLDPEARESALEGFRKEVWIVDESSQLNNADMRKLVGFASLTGARMAFIGDPAQLEAINAGRPFDRLVKSGIRHVEMTQIHRQRNVSDREIVQTAIERDIAKAMQMLDPNIREIGNGLREAEIVRQWWESPYRDQTLMVSMRNAVKTDLNDRARDYLRAAGHLGHEEPAKQLFPVFGARTDRQFAASYRAGDVLRFGRNFKALGIEAGSYWHVVAADEKVSANRLTIADGESRVLTFDARDAKNALRQTEHFRPRDTTLAVHDKLVWNRPDREKGLVNGDVLTVESVKEGTVVARAADGRHVAFSPGAARGERADQHWEHFYATSLYKSQGKTAERVLVDAPTRDAHLMNHHAFLVGVSRHREDVRFFTDDKEQLTQRIIHNPGDKTSAREGLQEEGTDRLRHTLSLISKAFSARRPGESPGDQTIRQEPTLVPDPESIKRDRDRLPTHVTSLMEQAAERAPGRDIERSIGL